MVGGPGCRRRVRDPARMGSPEAAGAVAKEAAAGAELRGIWKLGAGGARARE